MTAGRVLASCGLVVVCVACGSPVTRFARYASSVGMQTAVVAGEGFQHVIFQTVRTPGRTLHVYIDGDGRPWSGSRPTGDPTPRNPLVLRLMALDPAPSIYLGRPCYHGLASTPQCVTALWTAERYSSAVVASMAAALRRVLQHREVDRLVWFGYSGGGSLAVLLAPQFTETTDLVTVAANLDIDAWADLHGYSRLVGSLNPARQAPVPARIRQRHYVGGNDRVVPKDVVARGPIDPNTLVVIPPYDHTCCWETIWPTVLAEVGGAPASRR